MAAKPGNFRENTLGVEHVGGSEDGGNASKLTRGTAKSRSYKQAVGNHHDYHSPSTSNNDTNANHVEEKNQNPCTDSDVCDWTDNAINGKHMWVDSEASGTLCYLYDFDCVKSGARKKCTACKIVIHTKCMEKLERINFICKTTFREIQPKGVHESNMRHHWVHRRRQDGRCETCGKSFQHMLSFQSKDIISISCSWCKVAYHNKDECFKVDRIEELCDLGVHSNVIVPPSWVVKIPKKGRSFPTKRNSFKKKSIKRRSTKERKPFVIKPSGSANKRPLVVFINPKSGGNQGLRIMHKFQWLLNPRQVFDLSREGPREGLELYRKVPNVRLLACGGDGTVGWILSELDKLKFNPRPPVAILPLGTGNDLSRALNWGGGYADEPLSKILTHVDEGSVVQLDRWDLEVVPSGYTDGEIAESRLPLNVMNNYFSLGFDAEVCLEFHESREAHPAKFNSRVKNKLFYGKASSTTFIQGKAKDFYKHTKLECDGVDITEKLLEAKPMCLLFLNISKYSAGTSPWGNPGRDHEFLPQRSDDGYIEVLALTSATLATTRVGGHGERLAQCRDVIMTTSKSIPMQVDGEPCRLQPSRIRISVRNQADMIQKVKRRALGSSGESEPAPSPEPVKVKIFCVNFKDYELHCYDIRRLRESATVLTTTSIEPDADLEQMRVWIERFISEEEESQKTILSDDWCFLDTSYPDRVYRVDVAQENIYNVVDIVEKGVFIVDLKGGKTVTRTSSSTTPPTSVNLARRGLPVAHSQESLREDSDDVLQTSLITPFTPTGKKEFVIPAEDEVWVKNTTAKKNDLLMIEAAKTGELEKVIELHEAGVSLTVGDHRGWRPLHYAARHGHKSIITYIISNVPRCVLDLVEEEKGQTALHKAAFYQRRTICSLLVQAGASLTRTDYDGNTPRIQALKCQDKELSRYLETQEHLQIVAAEDYETAV
ncbi:diacylglycerol kinase zeta isoform X1 [Nematostella vectensis]|uniref:diacylglycerol kinase zeta isoform X1 n=2 Tax=Nematostella vectensis TaxID=45351 RepID=UPI0020775A24|nr:diacylglycerol kinase zeta isoform X1 [Nematostella vectensis]